MHTRRALWLMLLLVLLPFGLHACAGGSGSSGFEPVSEDAAIMQALAGQACVGTDSLTVCPTDAPALPMAPGRIETGLDASGSLPCTVDMLSTCNVVIPFMPEGFAPGAVFFRVAVRTVNPNGQWHVGAAPVPNGTPSAPDFDGAVGVDAPHTPTSMASHVQLAILVFLHTPPATLAPVDHLGETGAAFAYVTNELTLDFHP